VICTPSREKNSRSHAREKRRGGNGNHRPNSKKDVVVIFYNPTLEIEPNKTSLSIHLNSFKEQSKIRAFYKRLFKNKKKKKYKKNIIYLTYIMNCLILLLSSISCYDMRCTYNYKEPKGVKFNDN